MGSEAGLSGARQGLRLSKGSGSAETAVKAGGTMLSRPRVGDGGKFLSSKLSI